MANLGSGGIDFGIAADFHIHVDLVLNRVRNKLGVVANAEEVPLKNGSVDLVLCVGSVLNHGDARKMIFGISRILRPSGLAIIEFDSADSLQHGLACQQCDSAIVNTFFNGKRLSLVEYSRSYIENELRSNGLKIESRYSFHIFSAFLLGFRVPYAIAAGLIYFDPLARFFRALRYRGSNLLIVAKKS